MKLTTKGRYAVMALADLAHQAKTTPVTLADIADRQEISLSYLEQLFARLRRGGLVRSVRGPGGGYLLARSPDEINIAEIMLAVEETLRTTRCTPGSPFGCRANKTRCLTHDLWESLSEHILTYLQSVTLADVVAGRIEVGGYGADARGDGASAAAG